MRRYLFVPVLLVVGAVVTAPVAAMTRIVVDFSEAKLTITKNGKEKLSTKVVLPRSPTYRIPAKGTVYAAGMGPKWSPTANTRRYYRRKGKHLRSTYGPYARGNAMGHCKVSIRFGQRSMSAIRIHGNARKQDLGQRLSLGCIRVPDQLCKQLVKHARGGAYVVFQR